MSLTMVAQASAAELVRKTLPVPRRGTTARAGFGPGWDRIGLATLILTAPIASWLQLLTYRRVVCTLVPASTGDRFGYYRPAAFSVASGGAEQDDVLAEWDRVHDLIAYYANGFRSVYAVDSATADLLLPSTRLIRGIVTGTLDAWASAPYEQVLDGAAVKRAVVGAIDGADWVHSCTHLPIAPNTGEDERARRALFRRAAAAHLGHAARWRRRPAPNPFAMAEGDVLAGADRGGAVWAVEYDGWDSSVDAG